ncbi:MAG: glycosyltransferase [Novosphingobium sp.]
MTDRSIDVCICTFRRPSLSETLASIAAQELPDGVTARVIVADNDHDPIRREAIEQEARGLGLCLTYVHAPARSISIARNACLDATSAEWIAFIDDDEIAEPNWIAELLAAAAHADVVFGVSQADYRLPDCPRWMIEGDFHSNRLQGNDPPWNGYTANVLIRAGWLAQHRLGFALELGQVGGEDTMFFFQAHVAGARFAYAPLAVVHEDIPPDRATLKWLLRRRYRSGQVHFMVLQRQGRGRVGALVSAMAKFVYCIAAAPLRSGTPFRAASLLLRGALHLGVVAGSLGASPVLEYGEHHGPRP